jgi:hypothetical protein
MKCPKCNISFHPQTSCEFLGKNGNGLYAALYWQKCPKCREFLVFIKETKDGNIVMGDLTESEDLNIIHPVV